MAVPEGDIDERLRRGAHGAVRRIGAGLVPGDDCAAQGRLGARVRTVARAGLVRGGVRVSVGGRHLRERARRGAACLLVVVGCDTRGRKHFLALEAGFRESKESWKSVLLSLRDRGVRAAKLAVATGGWGSGRPWPRCFPRPGRNAAGFTRRRTCSTSCRGAFRAKRSPCCTRFGDCESIDPHSLQNGACLRLQPAADGRTLSSTEGAATLHNRERNASAANQFEVAVESSRNRRQVHTPFAPSRCFCRQYSANTASPNTFMTRLKL